MKYNMLTALIYLVKDMIYNTIYFVIKDVKKLIQHYVSKVDIRHVEKQTYRNNNDMSLSQHVMRKHEI